MQLTEDEMIASLEAFEPAPDFDVNLRRLYPITAGFELLEHRERVLPAMFALMERYPDADFGTPGPLVHSIESVAISKFEPLLLQSIRRQPALSTVWMINRILNTDLAREHREALLELLQSVRAHPKVTAHVADRAKDFLEFQASREMRQ